MKRREDAAAQIVKKDENARFRAQADDGFSLKSL